MFSSEIIRHVAWNKLTDVSKEHTGSIFSVDEQVKQESSREDVGNTMFDN
jgi:hypothetical protein